MHDDKTPEKHWDREQWAKDDAQPGSTPGPQGETWNRNEWVPEQPGETDAERAAEIDRDDADPNAGPLSGHGKPTGEGHWDQVEEA